MEFTKVELAKGGRKASFAVRAGPSMPTQPRINHQTLKNIQNDDSLSANKMIRMLKHIRSDGISVEPNADKLFVEMNHQVDEFFTLAFEEMEVKKEEEKEEDENNKVKQRNE